MQLATCAHAHHTHFNLIWKQKWKQYKHAAAAVDDVVVVVVASIFIVCMLLNSRAKDA